jgi:hypothetical protein
MSDLSLPVNAEDEENGGTGGRERGDFGDVGVVFSFSDPLGADSVLAPWLTGASDSVIEGCGVGVTGFAERGELEGGMGGAGKSRAICRPGQLC